MAPLNEFKLKCSDNVEISYLEGQRYWHVSLDGCAIALCPSQETAFTVARALKQAYSVGDL
jgi:hypothetical protein